MKIISLVFIAIVVSLGSGSVFAYNIIPNQVGANPPQPTIDINGLSNPISSSINSAKQIIDKLNFSGIKTSTSGISPENLFQSADNWLKEHTGLSIIGFIKTVGNIIVWILSLIVKLIQWGLSLI